MRTVMGVGGGSGRGGVLGGVAVVGVVGGGDVCVVCVWWSRVLLVEVVRFCVGLVGCGCVGLVWCWCGVGVWCWCVVLVWWWCVVWVGWCGGVGGVCRLLCVVTLRIIPFACGHLP